MNRTLTVSASVLTLLLMGTATFAHADDAAVRKMLEKQYGKIAQAYKDKNLKPLMDLTAPDYTMVMQSGKVFTRQEMEGRFNTFVSFVQSVQEAKEKVNKVTVKGNEATVDVQETIKGIVNDPQNQGQTHKVEMTNHNQDTWMKSGSAWLRKKSKTLTNQTAFDGKAMDMGKTVDKIKPVPMKGKSSTSK